jgi:hypothetical protein
VGPHTQGREEKAYRVAHPLRIGESDSFLGSPSKMRGPLISEMRTMSASDYRSYGDNGR